MASYWDVLDPFWEKFDIYNGPERYLETYRQAKPEAGLLFAAHFCQSEVFNGGLWQFFENSTGVVAPEAVEAYRTIGQPETADLLLKAMALFGPTYPRVREIRAAILYPEGEESTEELEEALEDLTADFMYAVCTESEGFGEAADAYAKSVS